MKEIQIYTDGACSGNPGPGGWAAVLLYEGMRKEISGGENQTTNNRMELTAAIESLTCLKVPCQVKLYTDSAYMVNAFHQKWIENWQKNGWVTKGKNKPVENKDLWQRLIALTHKHKVEFIKVKGHSDDELNNRCDELARAAVPR
ncbi:ribonuclease HI [Mechercharimyces sp. CAU 1602]|uniref:ribonuclease HI n=1 Tax=Mechercharimyces sp. CAU 1602 TaxID=2973933 RepID=UPI0021617941|nr:ribonuclease HI [Mechercharimyces sp. CAU 1602]MCS1351714.1 ribonuclease HI [Mechercharimyces sp. CAU 1602]